MTLASSVDYLSMEGLPWVLMAWAGLYFFRPFATLVHELGHFWNALILTKDSVILTVGKPDGNPMYEGKRVRIELSFVNLSAAYFLFDEGPAFFQNSDYLGRAFFLWA